MNSLGKIIIKMIILIIMLICFFLQNAAWADKYLNENLAAGSIFKKNHLAHQGRNIGGEKANEDDGHRYEINPELAVYIKNGFVIDYYYEKREWIPHEVKYDRDICDGIIEMGSFGIL